MPNLIGSIKQDIGGHTELISKLIKLARSSAEVQIRLKRMLTKDIERVRDTRVRQQYCNIGIRHKVCELCMSKTSVVHNRIFVISNLA